MFNTKKEINHNKFNNKKGVYRENKEKEKGENIRKENEEKW